MVNSHYGSDDGRIYPDLSDKVRQLQASAKDRRVSLPAVFHNTLEEERYQEQNEDEAPVENSNTPWDIENIAQLKYWAEKKPVLFLKAYTQCREQRDIGVEATEGWVKAVKQQKALALRCQQAKDTRDEALRQLQARAAELEEQQTLAEELRNTVSDLNAEVALARQHRCGTHTSTVSNSAKKSPKHPDPEPFVNRTSLPTFKEWRQKMEIKLFMNADHWDTEQAIVKYVCSRLSGDAAEHVSYRSADDSDDPYLSAKEVIEDLAGTYADVDEYKTTRAKFKELRQGNSSFVDFYATFRRYAQNLGYLKKGLNTKVLVEELIEKVNRRLKDKYDGAPIQPETLEELRVWFTRMDNTHTRDRATRNREEQSGSHPRTAREPGRQTTKQVSFTTYTPSRSPPPGGHRSRRDKRKQEDFEKGNCYICHEEGHLADKCPHKHKAQVNNTEVETSSSETDTPLTGSESDSEN